MSFLSPHRWDANGRAARLAGGAVLMLVIGIAATGLLGSRLGLWGRGAGGARPGRPDAGAGVAIAPGEPADVEEGQDARLADGSGADPGAGREAPGAEKLLAVWDHVERQIDAAMARARESVVALEYTSASPSDDRRRVASGVVISHGGEILSVRIDQPPTPGRAASGSSAAARTSRDLAPIVARDHRGRRHAAEWVAADPYTGLTLLRVSPKAVRPIRTAVDGPKLGGRVFVVGNPFGMGHSVSPGHVAGLDRAVKLGTRQVGGLIQVQAALYPGDSGAAVVDVRGDWLGLIRGGLATPGTGARPSSAPDDGADPGPSAPGREPPPLPMRTPTTRTRRTTPRSTGSPSRIPISALPSRPAMRSGSPSNSGSMAGSIGPSWGSASRRCPSPPARPRLRSPSPRLRSPRRTRRRDRSGLGGDRVARRRVHPMRRLRRRRVPRSPRNRRRSPSRAHWWAR